MFISNLSLHLNTFKFPASTTVLGTLFHSPIILTKKNIYSSCISQAWHITYNKQLWDEAEHDIKNYPDRSQCYLPKPKADNIDWGLDNSWYHA